MTVSAPRGVPDTAREGGGGPEVTIAYCARPAARAAAGSTAVDQPFVWTPPVRDREQGGRLDQLPITVEDYSPYRSGAFWVAARSRGPAKKEDAGWATTRRRSAASCAPSGSSRACRC